MDDWSDSDEEALSEIETSVLLGIPDGTITKAADLRDAAVSRIGGLPAFLPSREPPFDSSFCRVCSGPMELLMQLWCPFENSPMDRALYIWGCANPSCQTEPGSIRAWRGLRFNKEYAAKLEKREKAKIPTKTVPQSNPFSMTAGSAGTFGIGSQIFGGAEEEEDSDAESTSSEQSLIVAIASTTLDESPWQSAPYYPPLYLSTVSEYLPPKPKPKLPADAMLNADEDEKKDISWAFEPYENSLEVDHVFERFRERVGYEGEQCIRYELNGTPLPFSSDKTFELLFPTPAAPNVVAVSKPDSKVVQVPKRVYEPSKVAQCPFCKSRRVFECQIMPNLINVLRDDKADELKDLDDEARRQAIQRALKGEDSKRGLEWGTCMVFSCERDCRTDEDEDIWREEVVLIQADV